jgi:hypothetical protein
VSKRLLRYLYPLISADVISEGQKKDDCMGPLKGTDAASVCPDMDSGNIAPQPQIPASLMSFYSVIGLSLWAQRMSEPNAWLGTFNRTNNSSVGSWTS